MRRAGVVERLDSSFIGSLSRSNMLGEKCRDDEACHVFRISTLGEPRIVAQLFGKPRGNAGAAADQDEAVTQALRLQHVYQSGEVRHVQILLRHRLRYQNSVRLISHRLSDQFFVGNLAAEVAHPESSISLQSRMAVIAFVVEDGVDAYTMSIGTGAGADDGDRVPPLLAHDAFDFILRMHLVVSFAIADIVQIHRVSHLAVDDVVRGLLAQADLMHHFGIAHTHLFRDGIRRALPGRRTRYRQREAKLHDTVISMITEWLNRVHGWFVQKSIRMD